MNSLFAATDCIYRGSRRLDFTATDGRHVTGYHLIFDDAQDSEILLYTSDDVYASLALPEVGSTGTLYVRVKDGYKGGKKLEYKRFEVTT